jgi:hypothetical protein
MEKCLYPSPRRLGLLFFSCLLFLTLTTRHRGGVMPAFICFLGVLVYALPLLPGAAWLKLNSQGFTARNWFKEETFRWTDIKEFKLITTYYMGVIPVGRSVGFTFSENYPKRNVLLRIAGTLAQFDRKLTDNYGMKAQELAALLESCRLEAAGADTKRYADPWPAIEPK